MLPKPELAIMVVDDDGMVRDIIRQYLEGMGFVHIYEARNATMALQIVNDLKKPLDLILSDWEMPGMSGLLLLKAVRNHPERQWVRFIMITSQRSMERVKISRAANYGVNSYIVKPFRAHVLKNKIFSVMGWDEEEQESA